MAIPPARRMALEKTGVHEPGLSRCSSVPRFHSRSWPLVSQAVDSEAALIASAWRVHPKPARIGTIDSAHDPTQERRDCGSSSRLKARRANGATQNRAVVILTIVARQPSVIVRTNQLLDR